jgi:hypothetical protein
MPCARQARPKSGSADRTANLTSVDIADADLFYLAALDGGFDAGTCAREELLDRGVGTLPLVGREVFHGPRIALS